MDVTIFRNKTHIVGVYKGIWKGQEVAIKKTKRSLRMEDQRDFINEVELTM